MNEIALNTAATAKPLSQHIAMPPRDKERCQSRDGD
jgi:hypothetical protein